MAFNSLSAQQRVAILLELLGGPKYAAGMKAAAVETQNLARAQRLASRESALLTRRTFFAQQAMFTLRRYAFYGTLALTAMGVAVVKLGYNYLSAMQTARVSLSPVIKDQATLNSYLARLFTIAKYSPFVITDLAVAFRQLYAGLHPVGIEGPRILRLMQALTDYMSAAGKTSPGQMQRVALAIQHLAYAGRVTGYAANQLARLGIPVAPILRSFGVTDVRNLSNQNISADAFIRAIIGYSNTGQFRNAARRQALRTLPGLIQVARDTISQVSGRLIQGAYGNRTSGAQGLMMRLFAPRGAFDKISNQTTGRGTLFEINRQITGNTGLARGLLLLLSVTRNLGRVFATVLVPAFVIGLHSLIVFYPILKLINIGLGFLADHANIAKYVLAILAAEFIVTHSAATGAWLGIRLFRIATFGSIGPLKGLIRNLATLRKVEFAQLIPRTKAYWLGQRHVWDNTTRSWVATNRFKMALGRLPGPLKTTGAGLKTVAIWATRGKFAFLGWGAYILTVVLALRKLDREINKSHQATTFRGGRFNPITWLAAPGQFLLGQHPHPLGGGGGVLSASPRIIPTQAATAFGHAGMPTTPGDTVIHTTVTLDRKVLAEGVARAKADKAAKR